MTEPHILEDGALVPVRSARTETLRAAPKRYALDRSAWLRILPAVRAELEARNVE